MNILLTAILLCNVAILAIIAFSLFKIRQKYQAGVEKYQDIINFITPKVPGEPSDFSGLVSQISDMFARSLVAQAKAAFMGKQSGENRAQTAIDADIAMDGVSAVNPAIGAVLNSFPALRKTLRRNPALIDLALSRLTKNSPAVQGGAPAMPGGDHQVKFKL